MHAIQPSRPNLRPVTTPKRSAAPRRKQQHTQKHSYRAIAVELSAKLTVNLILIAAAGTALVKLIPYNQSQQSELKDLRTEVASVEGRVSELRSDFGRHFDPQQAMSVMQEQSNRINPTQRQIIFKSPSPAEQSSVQQP